MGGVCWGESGGHMDGVLRAGPASEEKGEMVVVVQSLSRVRLCGPMDRSTPGLPVHHQPPELTQTRVHSVGDAIQPSHPLSPPSPPPLSPSQHQDHNNRKLVKMTTWVTVLHNSMKL